MTDDATIIRPEEGLVGRREDESFFVGWSADAARVDRRFMLAAAAGLTLAGGAAGAWLAASQQGPGAGSWAMGDVRGWLGRVFADPYPLIRYVDSDGVARTALLLCETKCGVRSRLNTLTDGASVVRGSLLRRGRHRAIAVVDGLDWIGPADVDALDVSVDLSALAEPAAVSLGEATFAGEILDSKCWFGAMRPGLGKPHKACASLCIRHGVPPSLHVRDRSGREHAFVMTAEDGGPIAPTEDFLALVADPVEVHGEIVALGDLVTMRVAQDGVRRI